MRDHTKLKAYDLADDLALMIYRITMKFPKEEIYGLTAQMRRAAISVPSNIIEGTEIVEGCARSTQVEYHRFLEIAYGSLKELDYQFGLSCRLRYISDEFKITDCKLKAENQVLLFMVI